MSNYDKIIMFRGIERLLIVLGGLGFGACGMLLFKWGVGGPAKLILEAKDFKAQLVNASPGLFSLLFGAMLLALGIINPARVTTNPVDAVTDKPSKESKHLENWSYSGGEINGIRSFLQRLRGDESKDMSNEQIKWFRQEAGKILIDLDSTATR